MWKQQLCTECNISPLEARRDVHFLSFMLKQLDKKVLLKTATVNTRLHQGPVFNLYKPNIEKAKQNIIYRGATLWNKLPAETRNKEFSTFVAWLKRELYI